MRTAIAAALAIVTMVGVNACDKSTTQSSPAGETAAATVCDPLALPPEPIQLRTVLAAGRAANGTIWLVDHDGPRPDLVTNERLFESNGGVLQRVHVTGTGSGPDFFIATFADGQIRIELSNGKPIRMGETSSLEQDPKNKSFDITASTELTLVGPEVYASMRIANDSVQAIGFDAKTPDGHRFVTFQPTEDFTYEKTRVFYGTDARMVERKRLASGASKSGSQSITFDLDGVETTANLYYGSPPALVSVAGSIPLAPVEGSPGYGASAFVFDPSNPDAAAPPPPVRKPDAELTAGLTFLCF